MDSPQPGSLHSDDKLHSWKQIAGFLGKDEKTVRRYEKTEGLPVYRHPHNLRASVTASKEELRRWLQDRVRRGIQQELPVVAEDSSGPSAPEGSGHAKKARWTTAVLSATLVFVAGAIARVVTPRRAVEQTPITRLPGRMFSGVTSEGTQLDWMPLGATPTALVIPANGQTAYVTNYESSALAVLDVRDASVVRRIDVLPFPLRLSTDADGRYVAVTHEGLDVVTVIETTSARLRTFKTPGKPASVVLSRTGRAYIAMARDGLWEVDIEKATLRRIPGVICPVHSVLSSDETVLYVSCRCGAPGSSPGRDGIDMIDLRTERSVGTAVGPPLVGGPITISEQGDFLWIDGSDACQSSRYDHSGCPSGAKGVAYVVRISDRRFIHAIPFPWAHGFFQFEPNGYRVLGLINPEIVVYNAASFQPVESFSNDISGFAFGPDRRSGFLISTARRAIARVPFSTDAWEPPRERREHWWAADGTGSDLAGYLPVHGVAKFVPGKIGAAFRLDGQEALRFSPTIAVNPLLHDQSTLAFWLKIDPRSEGVLVSQWQAGSGIGWRLRLKNQLLTLETKADERLVRCEFQKPVSESAWTHVALAHSGRRITAFHDGTAVMQCESDLKDVVMPPFQFGGVDGATGVVDEITIHGRAFDGRTVRTSFVEPVQTTRRRLSPPSRVPEQPHRSHN